MLLFRSVFNRTIRRADIHFNTVTLDGEDWRVLPVTRYAAGMSKGLFYETQRPEGTCGTFYYLEPESTTYLAYKKIELRALNKTDACVSLAATRVSIEKDLVLLAATRVSMQI